MMRNRIHDGAFEDACRLADERIPLPGDEPVRSAANFGVDPLVAVRCHYAFARWMLGYPGEARATAQAALRRAEEYDVPFTLAASLWFNGVVEAFCRHPAQTRQLAERCASLCAEHGFAYWHAMASALTGWARVEEGQLDKGIEELQAAQTALNATGATLFGAYIFAFSAEAHLRAGSYAAGLATIDAGLALAQSTLDRSFWPELWRLKGELLLASQATPSGPGKAAVHSEAEQCLTRAVELARAWHAKSLELRALTSLARAPQPPRRSADTGRMLHDLCDWLGVDAENPDLASARAALLGGTTPERPRRSRSKGLS
jgi:adenylate cyclase